MSTTLAAGTATSGAALSSDTSGILQLQSGSTPTTAVTINTSQQVLIGSSSPIQASFVLGNYNGNNNNGFVANDSASANGGYFFVSAIGSGTIIGTIARVGTTSAVVYNTSSDRRLKSNIADLTNSGNIIDSLKPRSFTWVEDGSSDVGFIADELQTVVPKAVTGAPNAIDEKGNPKYQMVDASTPEMIAYLVAEVQSLRKRVATLEAKVGA